MAAKNVTKEQLMSAYRLLKTQLGKSPSFIEFSNETKIHRRHLERVFGSQAYSKLVAECGDVPNNFSQQKSSIVDILTQWGNLVRTLNKLPAIADWNKAGCVPSAEGISKSHDVKWKELSSVFVAQFGSEPGWQDVIALVSSSRSMEVITRPFSEDVKIGTVYLMKFGKHYKIGSTHSVGRREYEVALQLPEKVRLIHAIETDDPLGIEKYWHKRFESKRANGEWFNLTGEDITAFKRRKFM
jgi:hypothetical protein